MEDLESIGATTVESLAISNSRKTPSEPTFLRPSSSVINTDLDHEFCDISERLSLLDESCEERSNNLVIGDDSSVTISAITIDASAPSVSGWTTIRLISYGILKELDSFPRFPDDDALITDFSQIDWKSSFVIFISHCWLRGGSDCKEWAGFPHPDNSKNEKFQFCLDAISRLWQSLAPSMEDCYVWIDFSSLNQNAVNPGLELEHLDIIMEVCDCVLTPIVDEYWERWSLHLRGNLFQDYGAPAWNKGPLSYLNRAWCRMEMLYAATIPLRRESRPGGSRYLKFLGALKIASNQNRRPHFLYGSREFYESKQLLTLPPLRNSYFHDFNPANGVVRTVEDREKIESLMIELQKYRHHDDIPIVQNSDHPSSSDHSIRLTSNNSNSRSNFSAMFSNEELTKYCGELDSEGKWHGYGKLTYENGDHYEGIFHHGLREGYGILNYANGDQYRGNFHYDKRQGRGVMIYGNGNRYVGGFHHGFRNGAGVLTYADGSIYDGSFVFGYQSGTGRVYQANGDYYEGEMERDQWEGTGIWTRFSCGEVISGRFHRGKPIAGQVVMKPLL